MIPEIGVFVDDYLWLDCPVILVINKAWSAVYNIVESVGSGISLFISARDTIKWKLVEMKFSDFLTSAHNFTADETHLLFKFRVLNYFMMIGVIFGFIVAFLGSQNIMKIGSDQSAIIFIYSFINIMLVWYLRLNKTHFTAVAWGAVLVTLLLYVIALINIGTDEARVVWFYIAVYIAYMVLSVRAGVIFTLLSIAIIVTANLTIDLQITETAISTFLFALIVLSLLARAHALHVSEYEQKLREQNIKLEKNITEMDSALAAAQSANKVKSLFLANMSHEIRTPMNGVLSMAQVLQNTNLDEQQQSYLDSIKRSGDSLLVLIDDLLDLSKIESGTFSLHPYDVKTWDMIEDVLNQVEPLFDLSSAHFSTNIQDGLPASLHVDAVRLKQVIINLIANAAKFTPNGEVKLSVYGEYVEDGYRFIIEVEDNGIGIPKEKQDSVFGVFQQLSAERISNKGVGLGLAICNKIIEEMSGSIKLVSTEGEGSCFSIDITLPVIEINTAAEEKIQTTEQEKLRILVFEDDNISRIAVKALMGGNGHEVITAENGQEGIAILQREQFDVLLMDIHMPILNGVDATRQIKEQKLTDAPIIGMTASVMNDEKESYFEAGMDALVEKPIMFDYLMEVIGKSLKPET